MKQKLHKYTKYCKKGTSQSFKKIKGGKLKIFKLTSRIPTVLNKYIKTSTIEHN